MLDDQQLYHSQPARVGTWSVDENVETTAFVSLYRYETTAFVSVYQYETTAFVSLYQYETTAFVSLYGFLV